MVCHDMRESWKIAGMHKKMIKCNYIGTGRHNLRSFLAANLNQNYFLIACVKIFVTFGTKVPYLTFCNKM